MAHDAERLPDDRSEHEVWRDAPSQWQNLGWWVACVLVLPIPFASVPGGSTCWAPS